MATFARCSECRERGVVSMDQPRHDGIKPAMTYYVHHDCAASAPDYFVRLDRLSSTPEQEDA